MDQLPISRRGLLRMGLGAASLALVPGSVYAAAPHQSLHGASGHLPTGFDTLDRFLGGGLPSPGLTIVGGRPSMGKTALATSIALNIALDRDWPGVVALFSLEMSSEELLQRLAGSRAGVAISHLEKGLLDAPDSERVTRARNQLREVPLHLLDSPGTTVPEMKVKARALQRGGGLDLVIVDYLQLVRGAGQSKNPHQEVATHLPG